MTTSRFEVFTSVSHRRERRPAGREAAEGLAIPPHRCHSPPAGFSGEAMSPKVPSDWRLTWLLLGVIVGLLGLIVIEVVAKRYL
jgi:hypothetical protein